MIAGRWPSLVERGRSIGAWGWGALVSVALAVIVSAQAVPGLLGAIASPSAQGANGPQADTGRIEAYRASFSERVAQINGRSMFFIPPQPAPPPPPPDEPSEPEAPAEPERYGGPAVIAMINGAVWLENGTKLRLDESSANGLRLISINAPWGARIEWRGKEWDVPLFDRTTGQFLEKPKAESNPADSPAPEATPDE